MIIEKRKLTDDDIERAVSIVLGTGVSIAAAVAFLGGVYFLLRHGGERVNYRAFTGQPSIDRHADQIINGAFSGRARSIIQLGILLLIATPIARVAASLVGFALEGDRKYVVITAIVLSVLLYSLVTGTASG
ncbi:MAG: DUF1634 domain-containing protein [Acidobacteriaceae bacterium]|nr:DUF1634 domain-containing protein [Acidobacteriaceae bacterium]